MDRLRGRVYQSLRTAALKTEHDFLSVPWPVFFRTPTARSWSSCNSSRAWRGEAAAVAQRPRANSPVSFIVDGFPAQNVSSVAGSATQRADSGLFKQKANEEDEDTATGLGETGRGGGST